MRRPSCYLPIPSHLGLNNLDFSDYTKILPDVAHLEAHFANLGLFGLLKANGGPWGPQTNIFTLYV